MSISFYVFFCLFILQITIFIFLFYLTLHSVEPHLLWRQAQWGVMWILRSGLSYCSFQTDECLQKVNQVLRYQLSGKNKICQKMCHSNCWLFSWNNEPQREPDAEDFKWKLGKMEVEHPEILWTILTQGKIFVSIKPWSALEAPEGITGNTVACRQTTHSQLDGWMHGWIIYEDTYILCRAPRHTDIWYRYVLMNIQTYIHRKWPR